MESYQKGIAMSDMTIQVTGTHVFSGSAGVPGGSPAEQAYQRAVKALKRAQQNLSKDLADGADAKTLKLDNLAVLQAVSAMAQAQAAIAHEKAAAQQQHAPAKGRHAVGSGALASTIVLVATPAVHSIVDTYS
jgi:hypothetical protein